MRHVPLSAVRDGRHPDRTDRPDRRGSRAVPTGGGSRSGRPAASLGRAVDALDVALLETILRDTTGSTAGLDAVPAGSGLTRVCLSGPAQQLVGRVILAGDPLTAETWLRALAPTLVAEVLSVVGEDWCAEAEIGVELVAAGRLDDLSALVRSVARGPVLVDTLTSVGDLLAPTVLSPAFVAIT